MSGKTAANATGKTTASASEKTDQSNAAAVELDLTVGARQAAGTSALRSSAVRNSSAAATKDARRSTAATKSTRSVLDVCISGAPRNAVKISGNEARNK